MKRSAVIEAEVVVVPPFHDIDVMEVVWHGHYVKYLELARCALLDSIDYNYPQMKASGYAWPVVELHLKYVRPSALGQRLVVRASLSEWENRLRIDYLILDEESQMRLTEGHTIQVAVELATDEMCFVSPPVLRNKLGLGA